MGVHNQVTGKVKVFVQTYDDESMSKPHGEPLLMIETSDSIATRAFVMNNNSALIIIDNKTVGKSYYRYYNGSTWSNMTQFGPSAPIGYSLSTKMDVNENGFGVHIAIISNGSEWYLSKTDFVSDHFVAPVQIHVPEPSKSYYYGDFWNEVVVEESNDAFILWEQRSTNQASNMQEDYLMMAEYKSGNWVLPMNLSDAKVVSDKSFFKVVSDKLGNALLYLQDKSKLDPLNTFHWGYEDLVIAERINAVWQETNGKFRTVNPFHSIQNADPTARFKKVQTVLAGDRQAIAVSMVSHQSRVEHTEYVVEKSLMSSLWSTPFVVDEYIVPSGIWTGGRPEGGLDEFMVDGKETVYVSQNIYFDGVVLNQGMRRRTKKHESTIISDDTYFVESGKRFATLKFFNMGQCGAKLHVWQKSDASYSLNSRRVFLSTYR